MSSTTKIAVAVASGYLLGRTKKLKLAFTVAGLLAGRKLSAERGNLLSQGTKLLDSSPELKNLQDQVRGRLMEAARDAALTAASARMERMTTALRAPSVPVGEESDQESEDAPESEAEDTASEEPTDESDQGDEPTDEADQGDEPEEPAPVKKASPRRTTSAAKRPAASARSATKKTAAKKTTGASRSRSTAKAGR
jgi:hypothetical protein